MLYANNIGAFMARKKLSISDVVSNHAVFVGEYFDREIKTEIVLKYDDCSYEAKEEFRKLSLYANNNESIEALSSWIEKYIPVEKWECCKIAIRQHKLMTVKKKRYEYKTFRVPRALAYEIELYAEKVGLKKFAAIKKAIEIATKVLYANDNKNSKK